MTHLVGQDGILSTPAASHLIRSTKALGGIILTASHNPGGPDNDFGIKFNCENGGPAPEQVTNKIYQLSTAITEYKIVEGLEIDISKKGKNEYVVNDKPFTVEIIDPVKSYADLLEQIFDFTNVRAYIVTNVMIILDAMFGVTGPYVEEIFRKRLHLLQPNVARTTPLPDFGGCHPDPNKTHAYQLVRTMEDMPYEFGAAFDGDGDRNMILGEKAFYVSPGDSLAVIAHYLEIIPYFKRNGIQGFARSMPTSAAVDRVAAKKGKDMFVVPTGWKYFGNLMDAGLLCLCGEESFGTGSNHIREKDGIWAVLAWLSIMAYTDKSVADIMKKHWAEYGRDYFTRHDYEHCDLAGCQYMMKTLEETILDPKFIGRQYEAGGKCYKVKMADNYSYTDPIDKSVATNQGLRIVFEDGSRIVWRFSGTGSYGATIRMYIETYQKEDYLRDVKEVLQPLIEIAEDISDIVRLTGRFGPTTVV
ncbi:Phosphoglucomutase [Pseudolycoriella hygida]|uniref:phosphoglucomutase (alpha-D-glucose-1,6-bisphosphate-dependent) n=1 Tax=Pseudolycoriella hygida TaxID=35572 RepID=A0A9Q0S3F1_9DIPT|nr:Phosphoglucomutase [Pseudolycoriella hygida]